MKTKLFILSILLSGIGLFYGCSNAEDELNTETEYTGELRSSSITIQPASNIWELFCARFPNGGTMSYGATYPVGGSDFDFCIKTQQLTIGSWTNNGNLVNVQLLTRFDFSRLQSTDIIRSAKLKLYSIPQPTDMANGSRANNGNNNAFYVQQVTSSWDPTTFRMQNFPSTTTSNQITIPHTNDAYKDLEIDVTAMVSNMISNNKNYGFLLKLVNETPYNSRLFCNSTYPVISMRPSITIVFD